MGVFGLMYWRHLILVRSVWVVTFTLGGSLPVNAPFPDALYSSARLPKPCPNSCAMTAADSCVVTFRTLPLRSPPESVELTTIRMKSAPGAHLAMAASMFDWVFELFSNQLCHHSPFEMMFKAVSLMFSVIVSSDRFEGVPIRFHVRVLAPESIDSRLTRRMFQAATSSLKASLRKTSRITSSRT